MSLTNENMVMPVSPMYGGNGGFGGFGGDWSAWIVLFLIFGMFNGGWGMGGFGGGALNYDFPWLINGQNGINANTNAGFNQAATASALSGIQTSITSGFGDVQNSLCGGFAGVTAAVNGAQNALAQQLYTNQIADLERSYAAQTAQTAGMNNIAMSLQNCCCENRAGIADLKYVVATENCADRTAAAENTQAILTALSSGVQSIKDQLCSDKIEQKNDIISQLRSELMYARGQASQDVQTAAIQLGQRNLANEVEQYVAPKAVPAYIVQNPNCCPTTAGCGCNGGFYN